MQDYGLLRIAKHSEALDDLYIKNPLREENYKLIAEYILEELTTTKVLCIVIYGHPTVFVQPSLLAAKMAVDRGYKVTIFALESQLRIVYSLI